MEIVKVESSGDELYDVLLREKQMEQRRRDQKEHSHKHIWTKEPHGGRYKDVWPCLHRFSGMTAVLQIVVIEGIDSIVCAGRLCPTAMTFSRNVLMESISRSCQDTNAHSVAPPRISSATT